MPHKQDPISITSANEPLSQDQARRTKVYLIQMGIRVACFIAAIMVSGPLRWVLISMAVILPYIAVVKANLGRANNQNMDNPMEFLQLAAAHDAALKAAEPDHAQSAPPQEQSRSDPSTETDPDPNTDSHSDSQEPHNG